MSSISEKVAKEIIAADGHYFDDPKAAKVVVYENMFDGTDTYAIVYPHEHRMRYEESPACKNVRVLWEDVNG